MKKCLVVLTGILLLALFVPTASASFVVCQTSVVTVGGPTVTLTCPSVVVPTGEFLSGVDLELVDDAQGPSGAGSTIEWTWNTFTGVTQAGTQWNEEQSTDGVSFGSCYTVAGSIIATCPSILGTYAENVLSGGTFNQVTVNVAATAPVGGLDSAGSASARLYVQYDYSSNAPEPATLSLMGGALLGLGLLGKKLFRR
jgi:hypothetical protein